MNDSEETRQASRPATHETVEGWERSTRMLSGRSERVVASAIMAGGIALRVVHYWNNRSLWGDEVAVALNLRFRDFLGLLHPLSYDQTMPLGLLLAFKATSRALGFSELSLRLLPLLAGCALIILTWGLFSRTVEQRVAFLMVALVGLSPSLIYFSAEVKQYGVDALVTLLVAWLGIRLLRHPGDDGWVGVILGGAAALPFSQPVAFVLASIGAAAAVDPRFRGSPTWRKNLAIAAVVWLSVFLLLYMVSYRATVHSAFMRVFWEPKFIHLASPSFRSDLTAAAGLLTGEAEIMGMPRLVLGGLFLLGVYVIARKQGVPVAVLAAGPFALLLLAGALSKYPIAVRLVLFSSPLLFWIDAAGISALADLLPPRASDLAFVVLAAIFILPTTRTAAWRTRHTYQKEGTRDVVTKVTAEDRAPVYLVFGRYPQWAYYAGDWSHPDILQQRIDTGVACLREAQLGYARGSDARSAACQQLDFPALNGGREEIFGNPPPSETSGAIADKHWAAEEAMRIDARRFPAVWLFLPDEASHFIDGFPMRRHLLEKLEANLKSDGCREVEIYSLGETVAHKFECAR